MMGYQKIVLILWIGCLLKGVTSTLVWNQSIGYSIDVDLSTWSNTGSSGGCVTCPYTCVKPTAGPNGETLNFTDSTLMDSIPSIYSSIQMNGCCYAEKALSKTAPDCNNEANPPTAEACGFLSGPSLKYTISVDKREMEIPSTNPLIAVLFASIDCENFWAIGYTLVKQKDSLGKLTDSKVINKGCYGNAKGAAIVLAGCLTNSLKFDKSRTYPWQQLAMKCRGLGGRCSRTNSLWGLNLKCCMDRTSLNTPWDMINFPTYNKERHIPKELDGIAVAAIVFAGVGFLMFVVHCGAKAREKARQTALRREQEATDDYEEIITPLTAEQKGTTSGTGSRANVTVPNTVTIALHEGDQIYRPPQDEILYEGSMS